MRQAEGFYKQLNDAGFSVLFDDRDQRPGVKFKDADLLGIPLQVVAGKESLRNNSLELKNRRTQEKLIKPAGEILAKIRDFYHG